MFLEMLGGPDPLERNIDYGTLWLILSNFLVRRLMSIAICVNLVVSHGFPPGRGCPFQVYAPGCYCRDLGELSVYYSITHSRTNSLRDTSATS